MAHQDFVAVTGEGRIALTTPQVVLGVAWWDAVPGFYTRYYGSLHPRRAYHLGFLSGVYLDPDHGDYAATWTQHIDVEKSDYGLPDFQGNNYTEYLLHRLDPGVTITVRLSW